MALTNDEASGFTFSNPLSTFNLVKLDPQTKRNGGQYDVNDFPIKLKLESSVSLNPISILVTGLLFQCWFVYLEVSIMKTITENHGVKSLIIESIETNASSGSNCCDAFRGPVIDHMKCLISFWDNQ